MPIRLVLAEDHYLVREGVRRLIDTEPDLDLVESCADLPSLMQAIEDHLPDVVLTDIRMPPTGTDEGIKAADHLRELKPDAGVVVLSQYASPHYALAFLKQGANGRAYLLKERIYDLDQLFGAIRAVAQGQSFIDPKIIDALVSARSRSSGSPLRNLTPREGQILSEMAQGKSNAAIAASLVLSSGAIEKHSNSIFAKLGLSEEREVNRRVKAVLLFLADRE